MSLSRYPAARLFQYPVAWLQKSASAHPVPPESGDSPAFGIPFKPLRKETKIILYHKIKKYGSSSPQQNSKADLTRNRSFNP